MCVTAILLLQLQWTIIGTWHRCPCACTQSHNRQTGRGSSSWMCKNENCLFSFRIKIIMIITDHYILCVEEFWWYPRKQNCWRFPIIIPLGQLVPLFLFLSRLRRTSPFFFYKRLTLDIVAKESRKWVEHFFLQNNESATLWVPPYFDVSVKRSTIVDMSAFWLNNKNGEEYKNIMVNQSSLSSNVKIISHRGSIGSWLSATAQFRLDGVDLNLFSNLVYPTW